MHFCLLGGTFLEKYLRSVESYHIDLLGIAFLDFLRVYPNEIASSEFCYHSDKPHTFHTFLHPDLQDLLLPLSCTPSVLYELPLILLPT
jgi:hypothetical protein